MPDNFDVFNMPEDEKPLNAHDLFLEQQVNKAKAQFSAPRISKDDEGDLAFAIAPDPEHNVIQIRFAKPVTWMALDPETALNFVHIIMEKLNQLEQMQEPPQESKP